MRDGRLHDYGKAVGLGEIRMEQLSVGLAYSMTSAATMIEPVDRQAGRQAGRQANRLADGRTDRQTHKQDKHTDLQAKTHPPTNQQMRKKRHKRTDKKRYKTTSNGQRQTQTKDTRATRINSETHNEPTDWPTQRRHEDRNTRAPVQTRRLTDRQRQRGQHRHTTGAGGLKKGGKYLKGWGWGGHYVRFSQHCPHPHNSPPSGR